MRCSSCNSESPTGAKFCIECGAPIPRRCGSCGTENVARARFCGECAAQLSPDAPAPPIAAADAPRARTPAHLAAKILTSRASLEGERKQVTVLFADLKGSMELLADRDPEEARGYLDPVLERMMDAVHQYEGTVNQVMGDGIMALFGAPIAHEDHAVRACYAALRMQEAVQRYAGELRRTAGVTVQIRVGLNAGQVVVRSIGSDLHMDYTAVGQTTHLAARMEQMALPGSILVTADVLALAEGYVDALSLGPVPVKGLETPLEVFELRGAGSARTRLEAAAARGLTPFVGREPELDALRRALTRAAGGAGQLVAVAGDAGVGKSRLTREFIRNQVADGWRVLGMSSVAYGQASPFLPVAEMLRGYFELDPRDAPSVSATRVGSRLVSLDEARFPTLQALQALLDLPVDDVERWDALDPGQRRQNMLDAVKRLLLRESRVQPVLLVVEDLQWIDAGTQAVLDGLVDGIPSAPFLVLGEHRPEYRHPWGGKSHVAQFRLDAFDPEAADAMLARLVGSEPELEPLRRLLAERTEGNPFFLEESVRTLVETGVVEGESGSRRLARPLPDIQVPASVEVVLAARIDRLAPDHKHLLQTAAVVGRVVPFGLLKSVADLPDEGFRSGLAQLQAAELLHEADLFPDLEYTFRQALTREVAYRSLLQDRRRALHARIVDVLESEDQAMSVADLDRLAHHAVQGEVWDRAVEYNQRAGARAYARGGHKEAVAFLESAVTALRHLPEGRERDERALDLRLALHYALVPLGDFGLMLEHLRVAESLAESLDDRSRLARVSSHLAHHYWVTGQHDRAVEAGDRAAAIAKQLGDDGLEAETNLNVGLAWRSRGELRLAMAHFRSNVASIEDDPAPARWSVGGSLPLASSSYLVWCLADLGEFAEGTVRGEQGLRLAEAMDQREALIFGHRGIAYLHLVRGELAPAIELLERGLDLCADLPGFFPWMAANLGHALALHGDADRGIGLLERAVQAAAGRVGHIGRQVALAEACLLGGRRGDAVARAREALELARIHGERGQEAQALRVLGDARDGLADQHYLQARDLAGELGMRPLLAHCYRGIAELRDGEGRSDEARAAAAVARGLYEGMEMYFWLEQPDMAPAAERPRPDREPVVR